MARLADLSVGSRSSSASPSKPCSSIARALARASVPAPPVMTALPLMAKRARARSVAVPWCMLYKGAVRGFEAVERIIVGIVRFVKASLASGGGAPGIPASPILDCVEMS